MLSAASRLLALFDVELAAELADEAALAVPLGELSGHEQKISGSHERHVVGAGRARLRQLDL